jgi:hypothetical protein
VLGFEQRRAQRSDRGGAIGPTGVRKSVSKLSTKTVVPVVEAGKVEKRRKWFGETDLMDVRVF